MLLDGAGVRRDAPAALRWFVRAAAQHHVMAINMVGRCYDLGWGTAPDKVRAADCYRVAAEQGLDWAMYNYATLLALGQGVVEDKAAALAWFRKAAAIGGDLAGAKATNFIGSFHEDGWVVPRDHGGGGALLRARGARRGFPRGVQPRADARCGGQDRGCDRLAQARWRQRDPGVRRQGRRVAGRVRHRRVPRARRPGDPGRGMLTIVPDLLTPAQVAALREQLDAADWIDGNATSGAQSALAKRNTQLPEDSAAARNGGSMVLDALGASPLFVAAALAAQGLPAAVQPLCRRATRFGAHVDSAIRIRRGSDFRIRSDLSATLVPVRSRERTTAASWSITTQFGEQRVKLPAGQLVLYPASSIHHVTPVTRGTRVASFFWIQSMVRDDSARAHAVRARYRGPIHRRPARWRRSRDRRPDRRLSQSVTPLGGGLMSKIALRRAWFQVHKWIGLLLAVLIIPLSLSGAVLVWDEAVDRIINPARYAVSGTTTLDPQRYVAAARAVLNPGGPDRQPRAAGW